MTISLEIEQRLFSLVSLFATKLRTSLNDDMLNILVILKCHFKRAKAEADRMRKEERQRALADEAN